VIAEDRRRIDKWLWYARLARTRTTAQALAVSGRVRVNSEKNQSASRPLKAGDVLTVALDSGVRVLRVVLLGDRRGPASEARLLYEDLSPPPAPPAAPRAGPRPTKRDRRQLDALIPGPERDDFARGDDGPE
jgi:ribosome-associated heat shock protein Hsp15